MAYDLSRDSHNTSGTLPHARYKMSPRQVENLEAAQKSLGILVGQHFHQGPPDPPQGDSQVASIQADLELLLPKSQERHRPPLLLGYPLETHELEELTVRTSCI